GSYARSFQIDQGSRRRKNGWRNRKGQARLVLCMSVAKKSAPLTERKLQNLAKKFLAIVNERRATLDIFLLPHAEIKALKARFIKKQTEPNVLAFPEPKNFPHPELSQFSKKSISKKGQKSNIKYLGEVYLNKDILKKSPERTASLLLHG